MSLLFLITPIWAWGSKDTATWGLTVTNFLFFPDHFDVYWAVAKAIPTKKKKKKDRLEGLGWWCCLSIVLIIPYVLQVFLSIIRSLPVY